MLVSSELDSQQIFLCKALAGITRCNVAKLDKHDTFATYYCKKDEFLSQVAHAELHVNYFICMDIF